MLGCDEKNFAQKIFAGLFFFEKHNYLTSPHIKLRSHNIKTNNNNINYKMINNTTALY